MTEYQFGDKPTFHRGEVFTVPDIGGQQWTIPLPNGREVTVTRTPYSYGGSTGLFEAALWELDGTGTRHAGWLDHAAVLAFLEDAQAS